MCYGKYVTFFYLTNKRINVKITSQYPCNMYAFFQNMVIAKNDSLIKKEYPTKYGQNRCVR